MNITDVEACEGSSSQGQITQDFQSKNYLLNTKKKSYKIKLVEGMNENEVKSGPITKKGATKQTQLNPL